MNSLYILKETFTNGYRSETLDIILLATIFFIVVLIRIKDILVYNRRNNIYIYYSVLFILLGLVLYIIINYFNLMDTSLYILIISAVFFLFIV
jgi:hypothetical protein